MFQRLLCLMALLTLAACGGAQSHWAPDAQVARSHYSAQGPATITLFTVLSNRNDAGAHSALLINGSERILFDPAGSWRHPSLPERNDVWYGMSDRMVAFYIDYHARPTHRVVEQKVTVPRAVADMIAQKAKAYGAVSKAHCSRSISSILTGMPGFEPISTTWFPKSLMASFARIPGVSERVIREENADHSHGVTLIQPEEAEAAAAAGLTVN